MADDRSKRGPADRSRINMGEEYEVRYWTKELGVSKQQLAQAVTKAGPGVSAVKRQLGQS